MRCPECKSTNLVAKAHLISINDLEFPIINGQIKKIKRSNLNRAAIEEQRFFIKCNDCGFKTENLLSDIATGYEKHEEDSIMDQIVNFIDNKPDRKPINYEKKYRKFLASDPSKDEINKYIDNIKRLDGANLFKELLEEYYK